MATIFSFKSTHYFFSLLWGQIHHNMLWEDGKRCHFTWSWAHFFITSQEWEKKVCERRRDGETKKNIYRVKKYGIQLQTQTTVEKASSSRALWEIKGVRKACLATQIANLSRWNFMEKKKKKSFSQPAKPLIRIKTHNFKLSLELHDM